MSEEPKDISLQVSEDSTEPAGNRFAKAHHILLYFIAAVIVLWLVSGFYTVSSSEVALIERLGQFVATPDGKAVQVTAGLHYHIPWPIDTIHKVPITQQLTLNVDAFNVSPDTYADFKRDKLREGWPQEILNALYDPYLITGDRNVVNMEISVRYQIANPEAWLTTFSHDPDAPTETEANNREQILQQIAQHTLVNVIATKNVDDVVLLSPQLSTELHNRFETAFVLNLPGSSEHGDDPTHPHIIDLGVVVNSADVRAAKPPDYVKRAFDNVLQAKNEAETQKLKAQTERDSSITTAKAEATNMISQAESYKTLVIAEASGEADRFKEVLSQYTANPETTMSKLYADTALTVMTNAERIIYAVPGQETWLPIKEREFDQKQVNPNPGR